MLEGYKLDYGEELASGLSGSRTNWGFADGTTERTNGARLHGALPPRVRREAARVQGYVRGVRGAQ